MCLYKVSVSQRYLPGVFNITDGFGPGIGAAFTVDPGLGGTCGLCAGFAGVGGLILSSGRFGRGGLGGVTGFLLPMVPGLISPVPDETPDAADDFLLLGGETELLGSLELFEWNVGDLLWESSLLEFCLSDWSSFVGDSSCNFVADIGRVITSLKKEKRI